MRSVYTVTPRTGGHGSISPAALQTVHKDRTASFIVTPDEGYLIETVEGGGGTLNVNVYTTAPATEDCMVRAFFQRSSHTVTFSAWSWRQHQRISERLLVTKIVTK